MANDFADLSSNNFQPGQTMDVPAYVRSGRKYIMLKSSEGVGYHWGYGDTIQSAMHGQGAVVGRYHWLRPDADPTQQADYFVSVTQPNLRAGDDLMADLETTYDNGVPLNDGSDAQQAARFIAWANQVKAKLPGYPLRVYTGNWYLDGKPHMQAECRVWDIVMSDYDNVDQLPNPHGLRYVAWQFTDTADVPGFTGHVDYNRLLVPDATPADLPAPVLRGDDTMPKILLVNQKDCARHKLAWPGYFLCDGFTLQHIATVPKLHTLLQIGLKQQTISVAQYRALGGK